MKKIVISLPVIIMLVSTIINIYESNNIGNIKVDDEKVIITIWTKDRHDAQFQQQKIDEYNKNNQDNIQVEYKMFGENYVQAITHAFENGKAPDLMVYTADIFYPYVKQGKFADLSPYIDDEFRDVFGDVMVENLNVYNGKCYFIPTTISQSKLFYNKSIFERVGIKRPPTTVEELIRDAKYITTQLSKEGIYGFAANFNNAQSALTRTLMKQARMSTGIQNGFNFSKGKYSFKEYQELITDWRQLMSRECSYPNSDQLDIDPLRQLFAQGKIGMYISYLNAEISIYDTQFKMNDEWGYVDLPTVNGKKIMPQNCALNNGYLFNAESEHLDEAWKVYRAIFSNVDNLTQYYMENLGTSIIKTVVLNAQAQGYPLKDELFSIKEYEKIWPVAPHEMHPEVVVVEGMDMYETFKMLIFEDESIPLTLGNLTIRYNEAYQQAIKEGFIQPIKIGNKSS